LCFQKTRPAYSGIHLPKLKVKNRNKLKLSPELFTRTLQKMTSLLTVEPCLTASQLKRRIPALEVYTVRHIQRLCKETLLLPSRRMSAKPLLTQKMKDKRLVFCEAYKHWTKEDWRKVQFCDESHFVLQVGQYAQRCRGRSGEDRYQDKFTRKTVKLPAKVMVWGSFSWSGTGAWEMLEEGEGQQEGRNDDRTEVCGAPRPAMMWGTGCTHFLQD